MRLQQTIKVLTILLTNLYLSSGEEENLGFCADPDCSVPISVGKGILTSISLENNGVPISIGEDVDIYVRGYGLKKNLLGVQIKGKRGYISKTFVKEERVFVQNPVPAKRKFVEDENSSKLSDKGESAATSDVLPSDSALSHEPLVAISFNTESQTSDVLQSDSTLSHEPLVAISFNTESQTSDVLQSDSTLSHEPLVAISSSTESQSMEHTKQSGEAEGTDSSSSVMDATSVTAVISSMVQTSMGEIPSSSHLNLQLDSSIGAANDMPTGAIAGAVNTAQSSLSSFEESPTKTEPSELLDFSSPIPDIASSANENSETPHLASDNPQTTVLNSDIKSEMQDVVEKVLDEITETSVKKAIDELVASDFETEYLADGTDGEETDDVDIDEEMEKTLSFLSELGENVTEILNEQTSMPTTDNFQYSSTSENQIPAYSDKFKNIPPPGYGMYPGPYGKSFKLSSSMDTIVKSDQPPRYEGMETTASQYQDVDMQSQTNLQLENVLPSSTKSVSSMENPLTGDIFVASEVVGSAGLTTMQAIISPVIQVANTDLPISQQPVSSYQSSDDVSSHPSHVASKFNQLNPSHATEAGDTNIFKKQQASSLSGSSSKTSVHESHISTSFKLAESNMVRSSEPGLQHQTTVSSHSIDIDPTSSLEKGSDMATDNHKPPASVLHPDMTTVHKEVPTTKIQDIPVKSDSNLDNSNIADVNSRENDFKSWNTFNVNLKSSSELGLKTQIVPTESIETSPPMPDIVESTADSIRLSDMPMDNHRPYSEEIHQDVTAQRNEVPDVKNLNIPDLDLESSNDNNYIPDFAENDLNSQDTFNGLNNDNEEEENENQEGKNDEEDTAENLHTLPDDNHVSPQRQILQDDEYSSSNADIESSTEPLSETNFPDPDVKVENSDSSGYFSIIGIFQNSVDSLRSLLDYIILLVPEPIYSYIDYSGISARAVVFTAIISFPCAFLFFAAFFITERSKEQILMEELRDAEQKLYVATTERDILRDETKNLKNQLTEVDSTLSEEKNLTTELQKRLQEMEFINRNVNFEQKTSTDVIKELHERNDQYMEQIEELKSALSEFQKLNEETSRQLLEAQNTILELNEEIDKLKDEIEQLSDEKEQDSTYYTESKKQYEEKIAQYEESCRQLLVEAGDWDAKVKELNDFLYTETSSKEKLHTLLEERNAEIESLKTALSNIDALKNMKDEDDDRDFEEKLKALLDASSVQNHLKKAEETVNSLEDQLKLEKGRSMDLKVELLEAQSEAEKFQSYYNQAVKEKDETQQKLDFFTQYFKEKELQMQKELGLQEAMRQKKEEDVTHSERRIHLIENENESYKYQVATLKQEIEETERNLKNQIAAQEKKAHENWLAARAAERKAEELKQETSQLRQRLTLLEREQENWMNSSQSDIVRPVAQRMSDVLDMSGSHDGSISAEFVPRLEDMPMRPSSRSMIPPPPPPVPLMPPPPFMPPFDPMMPMPPRPHHWRLMPNKHYDSDRRNTPSDFDGKKHHTPPFHESDRRSMSPLDGNRSRGSTPPEMLPDFHNVPPPMSRHPDFPPPLPSSRFLPPMHRPYKGPPPHRTGNGPPGNNSSRQFNDRRQHTDADV